MDNTQKTVLVLQPSELQGQIWKTALASQGIIVTVDDSNKSPIELFRRIRSSGFNLPSLALIEIGDLNSNPYELCRSCRADYPETEIILTNSKQKEISAPERRWAVFQGVQDLFPGFQPDSRLEDLLPRISRVLEVLGWPTLQKDRLTEAIVTFTPLTLQPKKPDANSAQTMANSLADPLEISFEPGSFSSFQPVSSEMAPPRPSAQKPKKPKKPPDDPSSGMMYRGARLK